MTENKRYVYIEHKNADYILEDPNYELDFIEMLDDYLEPQEIVDKLNKLSDENEQLKSRNRRQYQQLTHIHELIDKQDWETVTKEREQMKEEDKRLQEMENIPVRCMRVHYGDSE